MEVDAPVLRIPSSEDQTHSQEANNDTAGPSAAVNTSVSGGSHSTNLSDKGPAVVIPSNSVGEGASSPMKEHNIVERTSKEPDASSSTDWSPTTLIEFRPTLSRPVAVKSPQLEANEEEKMSTAKAPTKKPISFSLKNSVADEVRQLKKLQQKDEHIEELKAKLAELRKKLLKYETAESGGPDCADVASPANVSLTVTSVPTTSTASFESRLFLLSRELPALESSVESLRTMTGRATADANAAQHSLRSAEDNVKRLAAAYSETQAKLHDLMTNQPTWTAIKNDIEQLVGNHKQELKAYTKSSLTERAWRMKVNTELETLRQSLSDTGESAKRHLVEETAKRVKAESAALAAEETSRKTIEINKRLRTEAAECRRQWEEHKAMTRQQQSDDNLDQYRAKIQLLTEQNARLSGMENALYAREQEATRLRGELSALQDGNRQAQLHRAVLESRIRQLEEDKARLDEFWANSLGSAGSVELQQREAYENIQKIQMLTQQLEDKASQMGTWQRWYHKSQEEKEELQKKLDAVENRLATMPGSSQGTAGAHAELESLRRAKDEADTRMQKLQAQLAAQTKLAEEAKERADDFVSRLNQANEELDRVKDDGRQRLDKARTELETLKATLQKAESAKGKLERKIHSLKSELADAQKDLTIARDGLQNAEQHYVDENNRAQRAEIAAQQKEAELNRLRDELAQLKSDLEVRDKELQARSSYAEEVKELRQQRDATQRLFVEAQQKALNAEQKAKDAESQREELQQKLQDKQGRMDSVIAGKAQAEVEVDRLDKELKSAQKQITDSQRRLREMEQPLMNMAQREQHIAALQKQLTTLQQDLVAAQQRAAQAEGLGREAKLDLAAAQQRAAQTEKLVHEAERRRTEAEPQNPGAEALSGPVEGVLSKRVADYKEKLAEAEANLNVERVRAFEAELKLQQLQELFETEKRRVEEAEKKAAEAAERTKQDMIRRLLGNDEPAAPVAEPHASATKRSSLTTEADYAPAGKRALKRVSSTNSETPSLQNGSPNSTTAVTPIGDGPTSTSQGIAKISPPEPAHQAPTIVNVKKRRISAKRAPVETVPQQPGPSQQAQPPPEKNNDHYDALMEALRDPEPLLKEPKQEEPMEPGIYCPRPTKSTTRVVSVKVQLFEDNQDELVERFTNQMRGKPLEEEHYMDYIRDFMAPLDIPTSTETELRNRLVAALVSLKHRPRATGRASPARVANANKARITGKKRQTKRQD